MVKPEGDIAVTLLLRSVALSSDGVWREAGGEAVGLNLLELFPSGLGTPAHPASVEGRAIRIWPHSGAQRVEYKTLDVSVDGSVKVASRHSPPRPCPLDDVPVWGIRYIRSVRQMPQTPR